MCSAAGSEHDLHGGAVLAYCTSTTTKDRTMSKYRIALVFLIGWTVAIVAIAAAAFLSGAADSTVASPTEWTADDTRNLAIALGAFATWATGLVTITCITIVVRLGHLRSPGAQTASTRAG
jgi:cytochrome bd-type quinol oxidase subunit 2